jgi:hypothetical protein
MRQSAEEVGVGTKKGAGPRDQRLQVGERASSLPATPIKESAPAEEEDHNEDDEEGVRIHVLNIGRRPPVPSVPL